MTGGQLKPAAKPPAPPARGGSAGRGWGEQLDQWLAHGRYRDAANLFLLEAARAAEPFGALLDVGFGTGCLLQYCREHRIFSLGIDLSSTVIRHHRRVIGGCSVRADLAALPVKDATFPLVVSHGVIEHLPSPIAGVRELLRVTRPGGRALISVPSRRSLFPLLVPVYYFTGGRHRYSWLEMVGRTYNRSSLGQLLRDSGWLVERIVPFKAVSLLDWLRVSYSEPFARRIEASPVLRGAFGIMLSASCRKPGKS